MTEDTNPNNVNSGPVSIYKQYSGSILIHFILYVVISTGKSCRSHTIIKIPNNILQYNIDSRKML